MHVPIPHLPTLNTKPTWHNRAGRIDRSACAELTVRDARELAQRAAITTRAGVYDPAWTDVNRARSAQSSFTRQHAASQTPARVCVVVTALDLFHLHRARNPFVLQGDHRTPKSNALKTLAAARPNSLPRKCSKVPAETGSAAEGALRAAHEHRVKFNPNAGACREKILGLPAETIRGVAWQQQITLICPTSKQHERAQRNSHENPIPTANNHFLICPVCSKRVRKLFLPLCTEQEARDAHLAETWLRTYEQHIRPHMTELYALRNTIIARYAPLLPPRTLACRKCLGVRYGEIKQRTATTRASRGL